MRAPVLRQVGAVLVILVVATGCAAATPPPTANTGAVDVLRVIDGDSVELGINGQTVESRLIGINAPELADCQGPASKQALVDLAEGQRVEIRDFGPDRYGRLLVDMSVDGRSLNLNMVESGWALAQHSNEHGDAKEWVEAMQDAAKGRQGMWGMDQQCPPADAAVRITAIEPDPPGPDDEVLDQEWIELTNEGSSDVDLRGWALRDESTSNRYVFESVTISAGDGLRLRTGCGQSTTSDIYWCSPNGVWSNRGDTAVLLGPSGSIEDWIVFE